MSECVCVSRAVAVSHTNLLFPVGIRSLQHGVTLEVAILFVREQPLTGYEMVVEETTSASTLVSHEEIIRDQAGSEFQT